MVRTQIQLTEEQAHALKQLATQKGQSVAELIRESVDALLRSAGSIDITERRRRAIAVAGRFRSNETDLSVDHDRYLIEAYQA